VDEAQSSTLSGQGDLGHSAFKNITDLGGSPLGKAQKQGASKKIAPLENLAEHSSGSKIQNSTNSGGGSIYYKEKSRPRLADAYKKREKNTT